MKVKNMSWSPCVVALPKGQTKVVRGRQSLDVSEKDLDSPQLAKLLAEHTLIVLPEGGKPAKKQGTK